ncbi:TonB-dependent receptor plug domain-containing protein [Camelimonas abortus]|uniref:TonB-dependent receptor plug domain-containing protein n=1 Tax=Camelimonas abortus TaxID=1017184 RepID=A0ABV7LGP2_9HYPH
MSSRNPFRPSVRRARAVAIIAAGCPLAALAAGPAVAQGAGPAAAEVQLDEISVTANLTPTELSRVGSAVTVITAKQLEEQHIRFVADALRQVPGVAVSRSGPPGKQTQVRLRNSEANQTLVIIDGVVANDPAAGSEYDLANLLTEDIERIEVLRGPQSALYGSDAVGGVINIVTKKGSGKPKLGGRLEGGAHRTLNGGATFSAGDERFSFVFGAAGLTTDGFSVADRRNGNFEPDGYRNLTSYSKLGFSPTDWLEFSLMGRHTRFFSKLDGYAGGVGAYDTDEDSRGRQIFGRAEAKVKLFGGRWTHAFITTYNDQETHYRLARLPNGDTRGVVNGHEYRTSLRFDTPAFADASHIVTFAAQHRDERYRADNPWSNVDRSMASTGLIGEYQGAFRNLTVTASVRRDLNDRFSDTTTYRFTGAYRIDATGTKLRASYGTGVKNPTMAELFGYSNTYRGNPDLKPETARGWDMGVDQELWGDRALLHLTYFNQRIADLIAGAGQTSVNLPGTSAIQGAEVGLTVRPLAGLTLTGAYTYTDGEDAEGRPLPRRPRNMASLNVNYSFAEGRANVNFGVVCNGSQKDYAYDAFYNSRLVTLPAYAVFNVSASWRVSDGAELYARIDNLFDRRYQEVYSYGSAGRTAVLGARLTF